VLPAEASTELCIYQARHLFGVYQANSGYIRIGDTLVGASSAWPLIKIASDVNLIQMFLYVARRRCAGLVFGCANK
jgi:hypothetical protein